MYMGEKKQLPTKEGHGTQGLLYMVDLVNIY